MKLQNPFTTAAMGSSSAALTHIFSSLSSSSSLDKLCSSNPAQTLVKPSIFFLQKQNFLLLKTCGTTLIKHTSHTFSKTPITITRATLDEKEQDTSTPVAVQDDDEGTQQPDEEVKRCVEVLKDAAKTRKVPAEDILLAFAVLEKAKLDPSRFFETLGGSESPGRTWMLIFTAEKKLTGGKYFPVTAVQRFDAAGKRIENGIYLGPLGCLTFEGRLSWKKRILAFIFERVRIKVGPFGPFEISIKGEDESEPSSKNPFFIWFYIDEEIAVAQGKQGGTAFWCRCRQVSS